MIEESARTVRLNRGSEPFKEPEIGQTHGDVIVIFVRRRVPVLSSFFVSEDSRHNPPKSMVTYSSDSGDIEPLRRFHFFKPIQYKYFMFPSAHGSKASPSPSDLLMTG